MPPPAQSRFRRSHCGAASAASLLAGASAGCTASLDASSAAAASHSADGLGGLGLLHLGRSPLRGGGGLPARLRQRLRRRLLGLRSTPLRGLGRGLPGTRGLLLGLRGRLPAVALGRLGPGDGRLVGLPRRRSRSRRVRPVLRRPPREGCRPRPGLACSTRPRARQARGGGGQSRWPRPRRRTRRRAPATATRQSQPDGVRRACRSRWTRREEAGSPLLRHAPVAGTGRQSTPLWTSPAGKGLRGPGDRRVLRHGVAVADEVARGGERYGVLGLPAEVEALLGLRARRSPR